MKYVYQSKQTIYILIYSAENQILQGVSDKKQHLRDGYSIAISIHR